MFGLKKMDKSLSDHFYFPYRLRRPSSSERAVEGDEGFELGGEGESQI